MELRTHLLPAGSLVLLCAACASGPPRIAEQRVVALPREEQQALIDEERRVDVAQANLAAARISLQQAKLFDELVEHEVDAAEANREAADEALELARSSHDQARISEVEQNDALWTQRLKTAEAKAEYSQRLVELREQEVEQHEAGAKLASFEFERVKYEKIQQRGMAQGLDGEEFAEAVGDARAEYDDERAEAEQLQAGVDSARNAWQQALNQFQALDARVADKMFRAPPEPKYLKPEQQQAKQLEAPPK